MKRFLLRLHRITVATEEYVVAITEIIIPIIIFASVIMRYFLHKNFGGLTETVTILVAWLHFSGGALVTSENTHISASIIDTFVRRKRTFYIIQTIRQTVSLAFYGIFFYLAWQDVSWMFEFRPKTAMLRLPQVIVYIPIAIYFLLSVFYTLAHIVSFVKAALHCKSTDLLEDEAVHDNTDLLGDGEPNGMGVEA